MSSHTEMGQVCALGHVCRCRIATEAVRERRSIVTPLDMRVSAHMCVHK